MAIAACERKRLLVIGAGMASVRLLEELEAAAPGCFQVTLAGAEARAPYNRVLLSSLLTGEIEAAGLRLKPREWYAGHGVELMLGDAATVLDLAGSTATFASGRTVAFDVCVLATGSRPVRLAVPGAGLPGVETFRTMIDVAAMTEAASRGGRAVVIGGGLLGLEAAYGLARRGSPVTLVHIRSRLMERQLDAEAAGMLKSAIEALGVEVLLDAETTAIEGAGSVEAVTLKDGRRIDCGLVVMATGVRPEASLAAAAGLQVARGVVVDNQMRTSHPAVYAVGECAEHGGVCHGLVAPAYEQARVLARTLAGEPAAYAGSVTACNLKVSGVPVFSAGEIDPPGAEAITFCDPFTPSYQKLWVRDGRLAGAILYGDTTDALWRLDLIRSRQPIGAFRAALAFGRAYAEAA